jgi:hypothetical protein
MFRRLCTILAVISIAILLLSTAMAEQAKADEQKKIAMAPRPSAEKSGSSRASTRFTLKGGVIYDSQLRLQWAPANGKAMNHYKAEEYVRDLSLAGGGWRLPTRAELRSLYDKSKPGNADSIFKINKNLVWTSELDGSSFAWYFYFFNGDEDRDYRGNSNYGNRVLAVRSRR